jgi:hypothetical protein
MKLSGKFAYKLFHLLRIDTDPDLARSGSTTHLKGKVTRDFRLQVFFVT